MPSESNCLHNTDICGIAERIYPLPTLVYEQNDKSEFAKKSACCQALLLIFFSK